ncbi:MAG: GNAT family N-acetyltransferase [Anaerolineales bacterium]
MSFSIQPITKENWRAFVKLKVRDDQAKFVATNLYSVAEAQFGHEDEFGHWDFFPFGIYDGDVPVGFFMYALNFNAETQAFVARLMADEKHQGRGIGRFGIETMLNRFRQDERIKKVGISYEPENEVARKLYAKLGFEETGEILDGEVVAVQKIR